MSGELNRPTLDEVRAAADRLAPYVFRTPTICVKPDDAPAEIHLKLENLQPLGAFKARPMGNAILSLKPEELSDGIFTASSGNSGLALAWMAKKLGVPAAVVTPDDAPANKLARIRDLGAEVISVPFAEWWDVILEHHHPRARGRFIDAVGSREALAGNGTLGLEILEQVAEADAILVPFGGGGVSCGIAAAAKAVNPKIRVIVCESEAATPAAGALAAGKPVEVPFEPSFISGMGATTVLPQMWPLINDLIDDAVSVPVAAVAEAIRLVFRHARVVAEGAGAVPVAAAMSGQAGSGRLVCVVTGGNLDASDMVTILEGGVPEPH